MTQKKNLFHAIELLNKQQTKDISQLAYAHNHIGNLYIESMQYDKAIVQHQAAIKFRLKLDDKKLLADSYNNLGVIYREKNDFPETAKYMNLALNLYIEEYGESHPFVGIVKNNLSKVTENQYHYDKTEQLLIDAHLVFEKAYGPSHYNTITSLTNLMLFYDRRMHYQKAIKLYLSSVDYIDDISSYTKKINLMAWAGLFYAKNGDYTDSNKLFLRIIQMLKTKPATADYLFERVYSRYAKSLILQNRYDEAKQQLKIAEAYNIENHLLNNYTYLYLLNLLAEVALATDDIKGAMTNYVFITQVISTERLVIVEQVNAYIEMSKIYREKEQYSEAHNVLNQALGLNNSIKTFSRKPLAQIYYQLGLLSQLESDPEKAQIAFNQAYKIQRQELPSQHPDLLATKKYINK